MQLGGDEYFEKGLCLIEWGEIISNALPKEYIHINFEKDDSDENIRILIMNTFGKRFDKYII